MGQLNEPPDRRQNAEDDDHVDEHDNKWIVGYGLMHKLTSSLDFRNSQIYLIVPPIHALSTEQYA